MLHSIKFPRHQSKNGLVWLFITFSYFSFHADVWSSVVLATAQILGDVGNSKVRFYNGNGTEWSAIWSEIIRVISKSNERVARVRFEITSMISDQNCTTRSSIATLLDPFWNSAQFLEKKNNNKVFALVVAKFSTQWMTFCLFFPWNFIITLIGPWNLIGCFVLLSHSHWLRKRCDLEWKMVRLVNKSHHWEPIRLQGKPVISKWI